MTENGTNAEIIQAMLDVLPNYRRWVQGDYETFNGQRHCMVGAYMKVTGQSDDDLLDQSPALQLIARTVKEQFPDRVLSGFACHGYLPSHVIPHFNDHLDTHYADVRRVLEKAAAHEEIPE